MSLPPQEQIDALIRIASDIGRGVVPEYQECKSYTVGAFDLLLVHPKGADAFELLTEVCRRFPEVNRDGDSLKGYFFLLGELAKRSGTTEMPQGLDQILADHPDKAADIRAHYRLGAQQ